MSDKPRVPFVEGLYRKKEDGSIALLGSRCKACGAHAFPASDFCRECYGKDLEEVELSTEGILHTYTVTRMPVQKFPIPHPLGQIHLAERVRIFAPLVPRDDYKYDIGSKMQLVEDVLWEEDEKFVVGYKFKQVEEE